MASTAAFTVWLTGLPASGKSAIGEQLAKALAAREVPVDFISSGRLRRTPLGASLGFSRDERDTNVRRHAFAAKLLVRNGVSAVVSAVSPYSTTREEVRELLDPIVLVHVATPRATCLERDRTGNWERALRGEIRNFTGVDGPYEAPAAPDATVDLSRMSEEDAVQEVLGVLEARGLVGPAPMSAEDSIIARKLQALGYDS